MSENQGIAAGVMIALSPFTGGATLLLLPAALTAISAVEQSEVQQDILDAQADNAKAEGEVAAAQVRAEASLANEMDFLSIMARNGNPLSGSQGEILIQNTRMREQTALDIEARSFYQQEMLSAASHNAKLEGQTRAVTGFINTAFSTVISAGSLALTAGGSGMFGGAGGGRMTQGGSGGSQSVMQ